MTKAVSESTLMKWWRQAVLRHFNGRCYICGCNQVHLIECHHIVKRRCKMLRYDWRNGITVCKIAHQGNMHITSGRSCHSFAETWTGKEIVESAVDMDYIQDREMIRFKDYLMSSGKSENEFLEEVLKELKEKANA